MPSFIRENAKRGLKYRAEGKAGAGLTEKTVRDAREMAAGRISEGKVVRMRAWFARHESDLDAAKNSDPKNDKYPGPGAVAWMLWGGNPTSNAMQAHDWADRTINAIENAKASPRSRANSDEDDRLRDAHLARVGKAEKKMNGKLRRFMMQERAKIIKYLEENPPTATGRADQTGPGVFDWMTFGTLLNGDIAAAFSGSFIAGYGETDTPVDTEALEYQENRLPKIAELVADERAGYVQASGQALAEKLNQTILKSYADGDNLRDTIKEVRKTMNTGLSRARTIARTEANIASTGGLELQAEAAKMKYKKWISEGDENVRKDHAAAAREGWKFFEDEFDATGTTRPGVGPASQVVNCRCRARYSNRASNKPTGAKPTSKVTTLGSNLTGTAGGPAAPGGDGDIYSKGVEKVAKILQENDLTVEFQKNADEAKAAKAEVEAQDLAYFDEIQEGKKRVKALARDKSKEAKKEIRAIKKRIDEISFEQIEHQKKYDEIDFAQMKKDREVLFDKFGRSKKDQLELNTTFSGMDTEANGGIEDVREFVGRLYSPRKVDKIGETAVEVDQGVERSHYLSPMNKVYLQGDSVYDEDGELDRDQEHVIVHELTHSVEYIRDENDKFPEREQNFRYVIDRQKKSVGEDPETGRPAEGLESMNKIVGDDYFGAGEVSFRDEWKDSLGRVSHGIRGEEGETLGASAAYAGKLYHSEGGSPLKPLGSGSVYDPNDWLASEVLTMGAENLYRNPRGLLEADPDLFAYTVAQLRGDFEE